MNEERLTKRTQSLSRYVYGPVPSARLGRSLGIDLVPYKTCTYDCIYCQLGRTTCKTTERESYVTVESVLAELDSKLKTGSEPDYISLAGSGEPTLNLNMGRLIEAIKEMTNIPVAVLTNGSLLWQRDVRDALMAADVVLPSLDAGDEAMFEYVNHPDTRITFEKMVSGLVDFNKVFSGEVWLEIFLIGGVTALPSEVEKIAAIVRQVCPKRVQLNTVSRPPAQEFADPVSRDQMERIRGYFPGTVEVISDHVVTLLPVLEGQNSAMRDILALLSRRPCTIEGVASGLGLAPAEVLKHLESLRQQGKATATNMLGGVFYNVNER